MERGSGERPKKAICGGSWRVLSYLPDFIGFSASTTSWLSSSICYQPQDRHILALLSYSQEQSDNYNKFGE